MSDRPQQLDLQLTKENEEADKLQSQFLVNFESANNKKREIQDIRINYSSLRKPSTGFEPFKRKLPQYFFVNPNNLNSPSFFLKKAQIILHKKTASVAPVSTVLNERKFLAGKANVLENQDMFEEWLSLPDSESDSGEGSFQSSFEEEGETEEQFDETATHISSTQINSKILEDLIVNIKFILNNRQVFYKSVLYFDVSEVLELWTRKDVRIRKFTVLLSSLLISHKSLKTEFISKSELNLAPGKIILNPLSAVKNKLAHYFKEGLEKFLCSIFEDRLDEGVLGSMVTMTAYLINVYHLTNKKTRKSGGDIDFQKAKEIRLRVEKLISKFSDSNVNASESPFGNSQDGSKFSSKESMYKEQSELNKLFSILSKSFLSLLGFDNDFFSKVTFLMVKRISQFSLNASNFQESRQREFDQYLNSLENANFSDLENDSKISYVKDEIWDSSHADNMPNSPSKEGHQNLGFLNNSKLGTGLNWDSKSPENSSPNPKSKLKNEIFWYFNFKHFSKKIFDLIFSKLFGIVSSLRKENKYLPKGRRCLRKMEKKLDIYSRQYCQKELLFTAVLKEKLSRVIKAKSKIFKLLWVEKNIHRDDVKYMYEEDLRFDINFEPQIETIPDCAEHLIGFEIKPWQLKTLSKMKKLSRPAAEDSEYVSGRLRDYLSIDQSLHFGDTINTNGNILMAIKENDGEEKSAVQNFMKVSDGGQRLTDPEARDGDQGRRSAEDKESSHDKAIRSGLFDGGAGKEGKVILRRSKLEIFDSKFNEKNADEDDRKHTENYELGYRNLNIKQSDVLNQCIQTNKNDVIQQDLLSAEDNPKDSDRNKSSIDSMFKNAQKLYQDTKNNFEKTETVEGQTKIDSIPVQPKIERRLFQRGNMRSPDQKLLKPVMKMSEMKQNLGQSHGPIGTVEKPSIFETKEGHDFQKIKKNSKKNKSPLKTGFGKIKKSFNKGMKRNKKRTKLGIMRNPMRSSIFNKREMKNRSNQSKSPRLSKTSRKKILTTPNPKKQAMKKKGQKHVNIYAQKFETRIYGSGFSGGMGSQTRQYDSLKKNSDSIFKQDKKFYETARRVENIQKKERGSEIKGRKTVDFESKMKKFAPKVNVRKILSNARTPFVNKEMRSSNTNPNTKKKNVYMNTLFTKKKKEFEDSLRSPDPKRTGFTSLVRSKTRDWAKESKFKPKNGLGSFQKIPKVGMKANIVEKQRKNSKNINLRNKKTRFAISEFKNISFHVKLCQKAELIFRISISSEFEDIIVGQSQKQFRNEISIDRSKKKTPKLIKKQVFHIKKNFTTVTKRVQSKEKLQLTSKLNESNRSKEPGYDSNRCEIKMQNKFNFRMGSPKKNFTGNSPIINKKKHRKIVLSKFSSENTDKKSDAGQHIKPNKLPRNEYQYKKNSMRDRRLFCKIKSEDYQNRSEDSKGKFMKYKNEKDENPVKTVGKSEKSKFPKFPLYKRFKKTSQEDEPREDLSREKESPKKDKKKKFVLGDILKKKKVGLQNRKVLRDSSRMIKRKLYSKHNLKDKIKREKQSVSPQTSVENQILFQKRINFQKVANSEEMIKTNSKIFHSKLKNATRLSREGKFSKKLIKSGSGPNHTKYQFKSSSFQRIGKISEPKSLPKKRFFGSRPKLRRNLFLSKKFGKIPPNKLGKHKIRSGIKNNIVNISLEQNVKNPKILSQPKRRSDYAMTKFGSRKKKHTPVNNIKLAHHAKIKQEILREKPKFLFRNKFQVKGNKLPKPHSFDPNLKNSLASRGGKSRLFPKNNIRSRQIKSASNPLKSKLHSKINLSREKRNIQSKLTKKVFQNHRKLRTKRSNKMKLKNATPNPKMLRNSDAVHISSYEKNLITNMYSQVQNRTDLKSKNGSNQQIAKDSFQIKGQLLYQEAGDQKDDLDDTDDLLCHETGWELPEPEQVKSSRNVELSFRNNFIGGNVGNVFSNQWVDPKVGGEDPFISGKIAQTGGGKNRQSEHQVGNLFEIDQRAGVRYSQSPKNLKNSEGVREEVSSRGKGVKLRFRVAPNMKRSSKLYKNKIVKHNYRKSSDELPKRFFKSLIPRETENQEETVNRKKYPHK